MKKVDFHSHSRFSDGILSPAELAAKAEAVGIEDYFLTDHDTVSGIPEALEAGEGRTVSVHGGIEINTNRTDQLHILGYGFDWRSPDFLSSLEEFRRRRVLRVEKIVARLRGQGLDISVDEIQALSYETLGRPHVADALRRKGIVRSRKAAFERYLTPGKPGYEAPMGPSPLEAIRLIRDAGGFASLAHPNTLCDWSEFEVWVKEGLEGIEAYYYSHSIGLINRFVETARSHGLLTTGGSDYHGPPGRETRLGVEVPDEVHGRFMERLARCSPCRS